MTTLIDVATERVKALPTTELIALHNKLLSKSTKRFATRGAGERAVLKYLGDEKNSAALVKFTASAEKKVPDSADRSAAIRKSWLVPATAKARAKKDNVEVEGTTHKSLQAAFTALKLPMKDVIKFRKELKAKGHAAYDGRKFKIVAQ